MSKNLGTSTNLPCESFNFHTNLDSCTLAPFDTIVIRTSEQIAYRPVFTMVSILGKEMCCHNFGLHFLNESYIFVRLYVD